MRLTYKMNYTDKEIIEGCKQNKRIYQKALYDKYSAKLYTICLRFSKDREDANDIFQEAFIKMFLCLDKFSYKGSFEGWLRKFFVNYSIDYYRKNKLLRTNIDKEFDVNNISYDDTSLNDYTDDELLRAIQSLNDKERIVFNMIEIEGCSYKDVSLRINMEENTIRSINSRTKKKLRLILNEPKNK